MNFQCFACNENIVFQTDVKLAVDLDVYSMLFPEDNIRFTGFAERNNKIPDYPLSHNVGLKFDRMVTFFYKVDEDTVKIQTLVDHLLLFQAKNKNELIGTMLADKNQLPALPPLFEKKKKKQHKKKKNSKKDKAVVPTEEEEEEKPVSTPPVAPTTEEEETIDPVIIKSNAYNGLFIDEYWLKTCGAIRPMCGKCDISKKEIQMCFDCSVYVFLATRVDTFFKGTTIEYRQVDVEHPAFFQRLFYSIFRYRTRSPRFQIVIAYSMLEVIMELIANPDQKNIGHTKGWYQAAHKHRSDAHRGILNHEKFHPLQLKATDSMAVRFNKLEEHVYTKFKIFTENSEHMESRFIASEKYSMIKDLCFASTPAPYNNKLSEAAFTKRLGMDENLKVVPVSTPSDSNRH